MVALARLAARRPRLVLASWAVAIVALSVVGLGIEDRLHRSSLDIPGTDSARADAVAKRHFGDSSTLAVVLRGPRAEIDRQGRTLARVLERRPDVTVLTPWSPGAGEALRPKRNAVLLVVRAERDFEHVSRRLVPVVRRDLDRLTSPPVRGHLTGYADIAAGIHGSTVEAIRRAELIAAPLLLIVLLAVFRSPIAAALPLITGIATISAGSGILELVNRSVALDAVALNLTSMMGLALGVDYALLLVSRFREELAGGRETHDAVLTAAATAGHTIVFAGAALAAAMLAALLVAPGSILASASFGVVVASVLSVLAALTALPAALRLLGPGVDRWRFGDLHPGESRFGLLAFRTLRRPVLAAALVIGLIAVLSAPALALQTGPPDPRVLPTDRRERADFDAVGNALGAAWSAPFTITVAARSGPITDPERLEAIERWQRDLARRRDVHAVLGVGEIARGVEALQRIPRQTRRGEAQLRRSLRGQRRLVDGLRRAEDGVEQLRSGLADAAGGAARLAAGGGRVTGGAGALHDGLARARDGVRRLQDGLDEAGEGAASLQRGSQRLRSGAARLARGMARARAEVVAALPSVRGLAESLERGGSDLHELREPARTAEEELRQALGALERMLPTSKADPQYGRVLESVGRAYGAVSGRHPLTGAPVSEGYAGLDRELERAAAGAKAAAAGSGRIADGLVGLTRALDQLAGGGERLRRGARSLVQGARSLSRGLEGLDRGGSTLAAGLARLEAGAAALAPGTRQLSGGAGDLHVGLASGAQRTATLGQGVERLREGAERGGAQARRLGRRLDDAHRLGRTASSGYLALAALDSAGPAVRKTASFAVNVDRGGQAAQIVVVGRGEIQRASHPLREELERRLPELERASGGVAHLGGPATTLQDFDRETAGRFWLLVLALTGVTYLVLVPLLRSLLVPLIAVVLNLLTVAAAFGVLVVLFQGDAPLGGPGVLDAIMVSGVFSVVFGLSIDYEVFLLTRMREGYLLTGDPQAAILHGLRHTAGVVTGAALIMTGVFVAFALSDIANMRQLGIGLTVAVLLDATLVRLVLLPAALRLCGDRAWWLPKPLERLLPAPPAAAAPAA